MSELMERIDQAKGRIDELGELIDWIMANPLYTREQMIHYISVRNKHHKEVQDGLRKEVKAKEKTNG